VQHRVDLWPALGLGLEGVYGSTSVIVDFLGELVRGKRSPEELGGPLRIAQLAGETAEQGVQSFIGFLAMLSVNLAIINLLPVPVLDGGQLLLLALESVRRRPLSARQREIVQQVGLAIMLFIMLLATFNDLQQLVFHRLKELWR